MSAETSQPRPLAEDPKARQHAVELALLGAALVAQRSDVFDNLVHELRVRGLKRQSAAEIILQSYLHDGYATALEGMARLQKLWPEQRQTPAEPEEDYAAAPLWMARGQEHFRNIYGEVAEKVERSVGLASAELALWMVVEGYGKVLSRGGPDDATRELATIAVLVMKRRPRQLHSHLRGALRVHASRSEIEELLSRIAGNLDAGEEAAAARRELELVKA